MKKQNGKLSTKISTLQAILTVLFVSCLLISNTVASKILLLPFGITMTSGVIIFSLTYILSDVFSEIYGYKWSRFTCYLAFAMNLLMVIVYQIVISTPFPSYWEHQESFQIVLGNTPRILFASLTAFVIGDFANDIVFEKMKRNYKNSHKGFGLRAIVSSLIGEIIDSAIFLPIAFIGIMPAKTLVIIALTEVSIKVAYEIMILPLTSFIVRKISKYEAVEENLIIQKK